MGIEYRHFLVVDDAAWKPQIDTVTRIERVLRAFALATEPSQAIDLSQAQNRSLETAAASAMPGPGVALIYAGASGAPVEALAGRPKHAGNLADRYTKNTILVVGNDYRVQWSSDAIYFERVAAPIAKGHAVEPAQGEPFRTLFSESFPSESASPPSVRIRIKQYAKKHVDWATCNGFWRAALVIDFGKDLPEFVDAVHRLPARQFVEAISDACRGPIVEIGEFY